MSLTVTCFYCGSKKKVESGQLVKLACDRCSSPKIVLDRPARFRCTQCKEIFSLPGHTQVLSYHRADDCRGRALVLIDY